MNDRPEAAKTSMREHCGRAAIIGAGVIGRSWAVVFGRAAVRVSMYDPSTTVLSDAMGWISSTSPTATKHITCASSLLDAVKGADWVQESGPDDLAIRRGIYAECAEASTTAILASSASSFDPGALTDDDQIAERVILAHPINPPHIIPAVELVPSARTSARTIQRSLEILRAVNQSPVLMTYVKGLVANRLQTALMREAFDLMISGVADASSIDDIISEGLGLRWALLGTFGTNHTNADGGIRDYFTKFGESYTVEMSALTNAAPVFDHALLDRLETQMLRKYSNLPVAELMIRRDNFIVGLRALKQQCFADVTIQAGD